MFRRGYGFRQIVYVLVSVICFTYILIDILRVKYSDASLSSLPDPCAVFMPGGGYDPPLLRGVEFDPENPLNMIFLFDSGDEKSVNSDVMSSAAEFFLAGLTIAPERLWVNFSPYEKDRIIDDILAQTALGRVMLEQDYVLKQVASSLTHPDTPSGRAYWGMESGDANERDARSRVWIVPGGAGVLEYGDSGFLTDAVLDVQTESDNKSFVPVIADEVNTGKAFFSVRQAYCALVLARWFKDRYADTIFACYAGNNKIAGIDKQNPEYAEKVWQLYCRSFEKGVYDVVHDKRRYISGGVNMGDITYGITVCANPDEFDHKVSSSINGRIQKAKLSLFNASSSAPDTSAGVKWEDYQNLARVLQAYGYTDAQLESIFSENSLDFNGKRMSLRDAVKLFPGKTEDKDIFLQSDKELKALAELVDNAIDAGKRYYGTNIPFGQFGKGSMQSLRFLEKDYINGFGDCVSWLSRVPDEKGARELTVFKHDGHREIAFTTTDPPDGMYHGTRAMVKSSLLSGRRDEIIQFLVNIYSKSSEIMIRVNGVLINPIREDLIYIDGGREGYLMPGSVNIDVTDDGVFSVLDHAGGMGPLAMLTSLPVKRRGESRAYRSRAINSGEKQQCALKASKEINSDADQMKVYVVAGSMPMEKDTFNVSAGRRRLPGELILNLPASVNVLDTKDTVEADDFTWSMLEYIKSRLLESDTGNLVYYLDAFYEILKRMDKKANGKMNVQLRVYVSEAVKYFREYAGKNNVVFLPDSGAADNVEVKDKKIIYISPGFFSNGSDLMDMAFAPALKIAGKRAFLCDMSNGQTGAAAVEGTDILLVDRDFYEKLNSQENIKLANILFDELGINARIKEQYAEQGDEHIEMLLNILPGAGQFDETQRSVLVNKFSMLEDKESILSVLSRIDEPAAESVVEDERVQKNYSVDLNRKDSRHLRWYESPVNPEFSYLGRVNGRHLAQAMSIRADIRDSAARDLVIFDARTGDVVFDSTRIENSGRDFKYCASVENNRVIMSAGILKKIRWFRYMFSYLRSFKRLSGFIRLQVSSAYFGLKNFLLWRILCFGFLAKGTGIVQLSILGLFTVAGAFMWLLFGLIYDMQNFFRSAERNVLEKGFVDQDIPYAFDKYRDPQRSRERSYNLSHDGNDYRVKMTEHSVRISRTGEREPFFIKSSFKRIDYTQKPFISGNGMVLVVSNRMFFYDFKRELGTTFPATRDEEFIPGGYSDQRVVVRVKNKKRGTEQRLLELFTRQLSDRIVPGKVMPLHGLLPNLSGEKKIGGMLLREIDLNDTGFPYYIVYDKNGFTIENPDDNDILYSSYDDPDMPARPGELLDVKLYRLNPKFAVLEPRTSWINKFVMFVDIEKKRVIKVRRPQSLLGYTKSFFYMEKNKFIYSTVEGDSSQINSTEIDTDRITPEDMRNNVSRSEAVKNNFFANLLSADIDKLNLSGRLSVFLSKDILDLLSTGEIRNIAGMYENMEANAQRACEDVLLLLTGRLDFLTAQEAVNFMNELMNICVNDRSRVDQLARLLQTDNASSALSASARSMIKNMSAHRQLELPAENGIKRKYAQKQPRYSLNNGERVSLSRVLFSRLLFNDEYDVHNLSLEDVDKLLNRTKGDDSGFDQEIESVTGGQKADTVVREVNKNAYDSYRDSHGKGLKKIENRLYYVKKNGKYQLIYEVEDQGTGMGPWELFNALYPLDETTKKMHMGQGAYTYWSRLNESDSVEIETAREGAPAYFVSASYDKNKKPGLDKVQQFSGPVEKSGTTVRMIMNFDSEDKLMTAAARISDDLYFYCSAAGIEITLNGNKINEDLRLVSSIKFGRYGYTGLKIGGKVNRSSQQWHANPAALELEAGQYWRLIPAQLREDLFSKGVTTDMAEGIYPTTSRTGPAYQEYWPYIQIAEAIKIMEYVSRFPDEMSEKVTLQISNALKRAVSGSRTVWDITNQRQLEENFYDLLVRLRIKRTSENGSSEFSSLLDAAGMDFKARDRDCVTLDKWEALEFPDVQFKENDKSVPAENVTLFSRVSSERFSGFGKPVLKYIKKTAVIVLLFLITGALNILPETVVDEGAYHGQNYFSYTSESEDVTGRGSGAAKTQSGLVTKNVPPGKAAIIAGVEGMLPGEYAIHEYYPAIDANGLKSIPVSIEPQGDYTGKNVVFYLNTGPLKKGRIFKLLHVINGVPERVEFTPRKNAEAFDLSQIRNGYITVLRDTGSTELKIIVPGRTRNNRLTYDRDEDRDYLQNIEFVKIDDTGSVTAAFDWGVYKESYYSLRDFFLDAAEVFGPEHGVDMFMSDFIEYDDTQVIKSGEDGWFDTLMRLRVQDAAASKCDVISIYKQIFGEYISREMLSAGVLVYKGRNVLTNNTWHADTYTLADDNTLIEDRWNVPVKKVQGDYSLDSLGGKKFYAGNFMEKMLPYLLRVIKAIAGILAVFSAAGTAVFLRRVFRARLKKKTGAADRLPQNSGIEESLPDIVSPLLPAGLKNIINLGEDKAEPEKTEQSAEVPPWFTALLEDIINKEELKVAPEKLVYDYYALAEALEKKDADTVFKIFWAGVLRAGYNKNRHRERSDFYFYRVLRAMKDKRYYYQEIKEGLESSNLSAAAGSSITNGGINLADIDYTVSSSPVNYRQTRGPGIIDPLHFSGFSYKITVSD